MLKRVTNSLRGRYVYYGFLLKQLMASPIFTSDMRFTMRKYQKTFNSVPDLEAPKTFNEKINWRKLYDRRKIFIELCDKLAVRKYVAEKAGGQYLNKLLFVTDDPHSIPFDDLPDKFVLKANHGSSMIILVEDRSGIDRQFIINRCGNFLRTNFYDYCREWCYKKVTPQILIEEYLSDDDSYPMDYKFYCFDGKVKAIHVDIDRFSEHKRIFYTPDWQQMPLKFNYPNTLDAVPAPQKLSNMISVAELLSDGFDFLRVDLFNIRGKVFFGELTLYPEAGFGRFFPLQYDRIFGDWWTLPRKKTNGWGLSYRLSQAVEYLYISRRARSRFQES